MRSTRIVTQSCQSDPLGAMHVILNAALANLDIKFDSLYAPTGRDSNAPEKLLSALIPQAVYSIRSKRALCRHLGNSMHYRWFAVLPMHDEEYEHSSVTRNHDCLIEHDAVRAPFDENIDTADISVLLSDEHYAVDAALIRAWTS